MPAEDCRRNPPRSRADMALEAFLSSTAALLSFSVGANIFESRGHGRPGLLDLLRTKWEALDAVRPAGQRTCLLADRSMARITMCYRALTCIGWSVWWYKGIPQENERNFLFMRSLCIFTFKRVYDAVESVFTVQQGFEERPEEARLGESIGHNKS